jgi:hypothetical protein
MGVLDADSPVDRRARYESERDPTADARSSSSSDAVVSARQSRRPLRATGTAVIAASVMMLRSPVYLLRAAANCGAVRFEVSAPLVGRELLPLTALPT